MIEHRSGAIKLVDFGFSKILQKPGQSGDRTYTKCGTPGYTAPEVLSQVEQGKARRERGQKSGLQDSNSGYSYACDVWSWGVLLCELIGGFNPFEG